LLTVALLIGLFMIALPIKQSVIWYFNVRRPPARNAASLFGPAILGAWFGDPDSAYALQTLPFIMATHGKPNGESIASRNCTIKMLERFWQGPGDPQKALSRLGGSVALSSYGDIAEAVRQLRPVMKTGESQMLNFYNAILLANSGDLTGAMKESDEGSRLSETRAGADLPEFAWMLAGCQRSSEHL
jgi:hypothetical protein